jgi:hypothetical protein
MNRLTIIYLLVVIAFSYACNPQQPEGLEPGLENGQEIWIPSDTLHLKGSNVVFFILSQQEQESVFAQNPGLQEEVYNFQYYGGEVIEHLEGIGIPTQFSEARYYTMEKNDGEWAETVDRIIEELPYGAILTHSNKDALIVTGIKSYEEYMQIIASYFEIEELNPAMD